MRINLDSAWKHANDLIKTETLPAEKLKLIIIIKSAFNEKTPMKTIRFEAIQAAMISQLERTYHALVAELYDERVKEFYSHYRMNAYSSFDDMGASFIKTVHGFILVEIIYPALHSIYDIPSHTSTAESMEYQKKRNDLHTKQDRLAHAITTIQNIEAALHA